MRKRRMLMMPPGAPPCSVAMLGLLLGMLGLQAQAVCPSVCSCSPSHREVDCSWRGLRQLPEGLQHNLHSLNLSHNRLHNLDHQLTPYAHLRILDVSHNRLSRLPAALPRALWELHAAANRIRLLDKNDTVYQWNLRLLDLSHNKLERVVFINNTMTSLLLLNLSHNQFWTVPTNMPAGVENVDLSHNFLVQALPGSLDRLPRLLYFYLHANRFSSLEHGVFGRLARLRLITLGDNPWDCVDHAKITPLLSWLQHTPARVLGCPCHTHPVCGEARPARTGGWHFASYTLPPLAASHHTAPPEADTGWRWYLSEAAQNTRKNSAFTSHTLSTTETTDPISNTDGPLTNSLTDRPSTTDKHLMTDTFLPPDRSYIADLSLPTDMPLTMVTPGSPSTSTKRTTTRTRSVWRPNQTVPSSGRNSSPTPSARSSLHLRLSLGLLTLSLAPNF